ncbi:MAG: hypothetical protein SH819_06175 [Cytophagales bacterium]|nr:hypothetical protein [Cytophagales bacterium]
MMHPHLIVLVLFVVSLYTAEAQSVTHGLQLTQNPPPNVLATRSVVLYDYAYTAAELDEIQRSFQKIGIDPIAYFETDKVFAGKDLVKAFGEYFSSRQISYLVVLEKGPTGFHLTVAPYEQTLRLMKVDQPAWRVNNDRLDNLLLTVWQDSWRSQKKQNYLINDKPETDIVIDPIRGKRNEFYAVDLKVDNLAVIKSGDEARDLELEKFFAENYPLKYKVVEAGSDELELRRQGFHYVLAFVHTRGEIAKEILGYDISKGDKNYVSITFPSGQLHLKIIPREKKIYKFYFRHIDNGNVFLGTKWDADDTWHDALRNHVLGFKHEAHIN